MKVQAAGRARVPGPSRDPVRGLGGEPAAGWPVVPVAGPSRVPVVGLGLARVAGWSDGAVADVLGGLRLLWAQPWARGWPLGPVRVRHQRVVGWAARASARARVSVASRGPYPATWPGVSDWPSQVVRGRVRLTRPVTRRALRSLGPASWPGDAAGLTLGGL